MLTTEAPAVFVLISQSMPLLFMENILALALAVFLAGPLIANLQLLLDNTLKTITVGVPSYHKYHGDQRTKLANRTVVIRHPTSVDLDSSSDSDINIRATSIPPTYSTPNIKWSKQNLNREMIEENNNNALGQKYNEILQKMFLTEQKTSLLVERSSSFVATDRELPIVDISRFDYDAYRYKLIKNVLKSQYGKRQAPGSVVLNSIHLSSIGSQSGIQLSEKYSHSLFDFIEEYYDAAKAMSRKEKEYLHPLDHFLVRGSENPEKQHTGTETNKSMTEMDEVPEMVSFRDVSPLRNRTILQATPLASELSIRSRRESSTPKTPPLRSPMAAPSGATSRKSLTEEASDRSQNLNTTGSSSKCSTNNPKQQNKIPRSPTAMRSQKPRGVVFTTSSQSNDRPQTPTAPKLIYKRTPSLVQEKFSSGSFTSGKTKPAGPYGGLSTEGDGRVWASCASASSSGAGSSCVSLKSPDKRFVRKKVSCLSSTGRSIKGPGATQQSYVSGNASSKRNNDTPEESSKPVDKQPLRIRPKSSGGRFASDVFDVKRPRTANAATSERMTSEKVRSRSLLSDPEKVVNRRVDLLGNDLNQPKINREQHHQSNIGRKLSSGLGQSKLKVPVRLNDKNVHSESFVMSQSRLMVTPRNSSSYAKPNVNGNPLESTVTVVESSSGMQALANRPGSISKLPIYKGADKITTKSSIERTNHQASNERSRILQRYQTKKSPGSAEGNIASNSDETRGPNPEEGLESCSPQLPKVQLSLEALQSKDGRAIIAGASTKASKGQKDNRFSKHATSHDNQPSNIPRSPSTKGISPVSVASTNKIIGSSSPQGSNDNGEKLGKDSGEPDDSRRPFLRAHSGKWAASKLKGSGNGPKDLTKREARTPTKKAGKDVEEGNKK